MGRKEIINKIREDIFSAIENITADRDTAYGEAHESFKRIGILWESYFKAKYNVKITCSPSDVAFLLTLFKMSREWNSFHLDNGADGSNYFAFGVAFHGWESHPSNTEQKNL